MKKKATPNAVAEENNMALRWLLCSMISSTFGFRLLALWRSKRKKRREIYHYDGEGGRAS
jgi:hypothetical protein